MNKLEIIATKQRQLGNTCIFGYRKTCKKYDAKETKCEQGGYTACKIYHRFLMDAQSDK